MMHADWLSQVSVSSVQVLAQVEGSAPPAAGGTPSVAGLPTGAQPGAGGATTTGAPVTGQPGGALPVQQKPDFSIIWMMGGAMLLIILIQVFAGRGERKRRATMMSSMGKGDKVLMTGGVIGTIAEMADNEIVVRVEEGKIRFSKAAVQQVLESSSKG